MSECNLSVSPCFFLGANTPGGFYSLFSQLYKPEEGWILYIIKGGPGTGKSTLMKTVAETAEKSGVFCERIYCSSDPNSLDGVIFPHLKVSIADGTSPHVCEPVFPGVSEVFVDLGRFRNDAVLRMNSTEIIEKTLENSVEHKKCTGFLRAAAAVDSDTRFVANGQLDIQKLKRFALRLADSELKACSSGCGEIKQRFLSAVTPFGCKMFFSTYCTMCERSVVLDDPLGIAAPLILNAVLGKARSLELNAVACPCSIRPEKTEHIIFPDIKLGFFTSNSYHPYEGRAQKTVHCMRFFYPDGLYSHKNRLSFNKKAKEEFIVEAVKRLENAKGIHDELEEYYKQAMDFNAVQNEAKVIAAQILCR